MLLTGDGAAAHVPPDSLEVFQQKTRRQHQAEDEQDRSNDPVLLEGLRDFTDFDVIENRFVLTPGLN